VPEKCQHMDMIVNSERPLDFRYYSVGSNMRLSLYCYPHCLQALFTSECHILHSFYSCTASFPSSIHLLNFSPPSTTLLDVFATLMGGLSFYRKSGSHTCIYLDPPSAKASLNNIIQESESLEDYWSFAGGQIEYNELSSSERQYGSPKFQHDIVYQLRYGYDLWRR